MIEARVETIMRGVETLGGGLYPAELAKREKRAREAKDPETARYCQNPECWAIKLDGKNGKPGKPQKLHSLNFFAVDKVTRQGREWSNYCSRCTRVMNAALDEDVEELSPAKKCNRGHDVSVVGVYSDGRCKECKKRARALQSMARREGYVALPGLRAAKERWTQVTGGSYRDLERATGYNRNTIKSWAHRTSGAPEEAIEVLVSALGCTAVELTGEASEAIEEAS